MPNIVVPDTLNYATDLVAAYCRATRRILRDETMTHADRAGALMFLYFAAKATSRAAEVITAIVATIIWFQRVDDAASYLAFEDRWGWAA